MSAFRFFGLVDGTDEPTLFLQSVIANPDQRPKELRALLITAFHDLIRRDLSKMTPRILEDAMEQYNVKGATKRKAMTFFLQAARYADLPLSSYLQAQIRTSTGGRRKKTPRTRDESVADVSTVSAAVGESGSVGNSSKVIHLKNGGSVRLSVSTDVFSMDSEDRQFVFSLIDMMQAYENSRPKNGGG